MATTSMDGSARSSSTLRHARTPRARANSSAASKGRAVTPTSRASGRQSITVACMVLIAPAPISPNPKTLS